jgi:hypothetical protein
MPKFGGVPPRAQVLASAGLQAQLKQALALHQQGMLFEAERIALQVLHRQPSSFDALYLLGMIAPAPLTRRPPS